MDYWGKAVLRTLCYADIFDYPLKVGEIEKYLIADKFHLGRASPKALPAARGVPPVCAEASAGRSAHHPRCFQALAKLIRDGKIETKGEYYFLSGRGKIVELRERKKKWSLAKIEKVEKVANILKVVPTVKLVGISGALAMENSDEDDDIDLFIVTSSGRLWLTRFLVTLLVELTGQRRRPNHESKRINSLGFYLFNTRCWSGSHLGIEEEESAEIRKKSVAISVHKDKVCLNMFLDEDHLVVPEKERNLFTAHEVAQMKKLWDRDGVYERFLGENRWVEDWLPNGLGSFKVTKFQSDKVRTKEKLCNPATLQLCHLVDYLEKLSMTLQLKYMEKRRTIEKTEPGRILFHPEEKGRWVLENLKLRMKNYS